MKRNQQVIKQCYSLAVAPAIILSTLALVWISGCNNITSNGTISTVTSSHTATPASSHLGTLQIKLTDAPARYDSVMIDIQKVEVQNVDSANGWVAVNDSAMMINLLDLSNGAYKVIGKKQLAPGTYPQIRLVLGSNNYVVENGVKLALKVPSGQQSGLKINVNASIKPDYTYNLMLDFNAARSIVRAGNPKKGGFCILKPVIRATNEALTGAISGTVDPASAKPAIYGINGTDTLTTSYADTTSGEFKLVGLQAGTYTVSIAPADTTYRDTTITNVSVVAGQTQQLNTVTLSKK